jgi:hypothetical protein
MATRSGQMYYKGQLISSVTQAKDVVVADLNNLFTASDLESILVEVMTTSDVANKVDKVTGMGLSQENYTTDEKNKLGGIEVGANNYVLPSTLPASIILGDSTHKFVTDAQITTWNAAADGSSIQTLLDSNLAAAKTYTDTNISTLKGSAPATLNTLNKLASAINNDPTYYLTMNSYIDSKFDGFAGLGSIDVETEDDLDGLTINVGTIVNFVTITTDFYQCTNVGGSTFATRFTVTTAQDKATCIQTTLADAMSLTVVNGDYIYIETSVINKSFECVTTDPTVTLFNDKYRILYKDGFVETKFTELINGAPGTLDTLNELATALNNDANFATTMTNQLTALNTSITNVNNTLSSFTTATNNSIGTINTTLTSLQNQIVSLQNADTAALDGGTF